MKPITVIISLPLAAKVAQIWGLITKKTSNFAKSSRTVIVELSLSLTLPAWLGELFHSDSGNVWHPPVTSVASSLPMRSTLDTSRMPSSFAADAKPPEPRAWRLRSASHFLKPGSLEASGILIWAFVNPRQSQVKSKGLFLVNFLTQSHDLPKSPLGNCFSPKITPISFC